MTMGWVLLLANYYLRSSVIVTLLAYLKAEIIFVIALCTTSLGEMLTGPTATSNSC